MRLFRRLKTCNLRYDDNRIVPISHACKPCTHAHARRLVVCLNIGFFYSPSSRLSSVHKPSNKQLTRYDYYNTSGGRRNVVCRYGCSAVRVHHRRSHVFSIIWRAITDALQQAGFVYYTAMNLPTNCLTGRSFYEMTINFLLVVRVQECLKERTRCGIK